MPEREPIFPTETQNTNENEDPLEKFLKENKSGTTNQQEERFKGDGASGTTDEAKDLAA